MYEMYEKETKKTPKKTYIVHKKAVGFNIVFILWLTYI